MCEMLSARCDVRDEMCWMRCVGYDVCDAMGGDVWGCDVCSARGRRENDEEGGVTPLYSKREPTEGVVGIILI